MSAWSKGWLNARVPAKGGGLRVALMHLDNIQVGERLRPLNAPKVRELIESIRELGLLNPITVTDEGLLVAGYHRLEACRQLAAEDEAWAIVPVAYFEQSEKRQRAEIAENLFRNDLSVLERAEHLELYLAESPTKLPADAQAEALGMSRKTFFNYRRIIRDIAAPLRTRIKALDELPDSTRQLLEIAAMPPAIQTARIQALEAASAPPAQAPALEDKPARPKQSKTLTLSLPPELQGRLRAQAGERGLNQGEFTRRLLDRALAALEQGQLAWEED